MSTEDKRALTREEFLRGTAGLAAAGTGMGLLVPRAFAQDAVKTGGVLHYVYTDTSAAETTDPTIQTGIAVSSPYLQNLYERLTFIDVPNVWTVRPLLAVSWQATPDARTWTFKLRNGVKFHNGKTLDSNDVKWSYSHILDKKTGSTLYARLSSVLDPSGIKTPSADTVVFRLKKPDAFFSQLTGLFQAGIYPDGIDPKQPPIGTGPFMHVSWKPTLGWQVKRNESYWRRGLPYLDGVQAVFVGDPNTKTQAVVNGSADISDRIPFTQVPNIEKNPRLRLYVLKGGIAPDYSFDLTQEPFTDPRIAQAVRLAVNRKALLQAGALGNGTVVGDVPELPIDPYYPQPAQKRVPPNIAEAKRLLKAAGKSEISFDLITGDIAVGVVDMATALKQVVAPAGININLVKWPIDTFWSDVYLKKAAFNSFWNHRHANEMYNLLYRTGAVWNESNWSSSKTDKMADAASATLDVKKQRTLLRAALLEAAEKSGTGFPYFVNNVHVAKKNVMGVVPDPQYLLKLEKAWLA
jgi:peptide/nickel transport system substrate-binding protein